MEYARSIHQKPNLQKWERIILFSWNHGKQQSSRAHSISNLRHHPFAPNPATTTNSFYLPTPPVYLTSYHCDGTNLHYQTGITVRFTHSPLQDRMVVFLLAPFFSFLFILYCSYNDDSFFLQCEIIIKQATIPYF